MLDDAVTTPLPADPGGPALARRVVTDHAADLPREVRDDAALLVSELVTNAVRYGTPPIQLLVQVRGGEIEVAVEDHGERQPVLTEGPPDVDHPSGRGLHIVAAIALEWGVSPVERGKRVWFRVGEAGT